MNDTTNVRHALGVGSVVMLHSGGPRMVVVEVDGNTAVCAWVTLDGRPEQQTYPVACLKKEG